MEIRFTGLRPGEKLNESLFARSEENVPTGHPRISATRGAVLPDDLDAGLAELYAAAAENDAEAVRKRLAALVPEYQPPVMTAPAARDLLDSLWLDDF
ncbi:polysaccharide biosynthesis protein [Streptacidiphilus monticola]